MWSITCPCPMRKPARALGNRYGALVMDSIPPATTTSAEWAVKRSCANIAAFMPEPHILLTVVQPAASGRPAPSDACRAGAWPWPAGSTQPMRTSWTCSGLIFARSTAARIAAAPSSGAAKPFSSPWKAPIGVRAAETMTIGSVCMSFSSGRVFQVAHRHPLVVQQAVLQVVDPAVDFQRLAALPRLLHGGALADVAHLLAHVQLAEAPVARLGI